MSFGGRTKDEAVRTQRDLWTRSGDLIVSPKDNWRMPIMQEGPSRRGWMFGVIAGAFAWLVPSGRAAKTARAASADLSYLKSGAVKFKVGMTISKYDRVGRLISV